VIDRAEFDREMKIVENELTTAAPADVALAELTIADFERFGDVWDSATPEERSELLGRMMESIYVDFKNGQAVEVVPRTGFRPVFGGAGITRSLSCPPRDHELTIGDPDGIRGVPPQTRIAMCCVALSA